MARLEIPCMILDECELEQRITLGEWRQDRHDLEAARIFGGTPIDPMKFPATFQRTRSRPDISRIQNASLIDRIKHVKRGFSIM